ncbi:MAG: class I SAM-dependent methyltransferase [Parcubacteria group bacterium]|jgi:ubiquinone/menaquinone biosynthesis C-methylase UbiE
MQKKIINKILGETEDGYDLVADKFSQTRKHFWRGLEFIKDYVQAGDRVLDFGCGNGRLLELFVDKKIEYVGVDVSQKLLDLAKNRYNSESATFLKIVPGQITLPFPDNYFNAVYSIAVFHHLPTAHAARMAQELQRVTKSGGHVVVTVWNLWQRKYLKNILQNWRAKLLGKSDLDWNDCFISFKDNQGEIFPRYHHAFTRGELRKLFSAAGFGREKCEISGRRNILFVGRK